MLINKKKKEEYVEIKPLIGEAPDYNAYNMGMAEKIMWFIVGFVIGGVVLYIFYDRIIISLIIGLFAGYFCIPLMRKSKIDKRKNKLLSQFKGLLETLSTSIGAGRNMYDSFNGAISDLSVEYSDDADIVNEVKIICQGLDHNIPIEDLLVNFGQRSSLDDVKSFANVFSTCYSKGGNIKEVIHNTSQIITDKIEVSMEIDTIVAGQKNEQTIMLIMPVVFIVFMRAMGGDLIDLESPVGLLAVTIALAIFVAAYFISRKILDIKL